MARIGELLAAGPTYSFEFFPPRTEEAAQALEHALTELEPLQPSFVSVTYGAGGSTRERTREIVLRILHQSAMTPMAHLSCIAHVREDLTEILQAYAEAGVENVLALAGDPPADGAAGGGELQYALELVELIREVGHFSIGVAAHPEGHPRSVDLTTDRLHLATKLRVADFGVTQFFFRTSDYVAMMGQLADLGVDTPVIPGIMPVTNVTQIQRFAQMSGATFPSEVAAHFVDVADDAEEVRRIGVELATTLCRELLEAGAPGLHFYTLNRSTATRQIYANLGLGPSHRA